MLICVKSLLKYDSSSGWEYGNIQDRSTCSEPKRDLRELGDLVE